VILHRLDPERAHAAAVRLAQLAGAVPPIGWGARALWGIADQAPVTIMGLTFRNRIGIAAGFDKDAMAIRGLAHLGVGHVEVGTVTPRPQAGNERPRVFRLAEDRSVINRMGFPSRGPDFVADRLRRHPRTVVGVNVGKARDTPLAEAATDYVALTTRFAGVADYLAINVSSPNTPGLRRLQRGDALQELLSAVMAHRHTTPVVAKLSPDLDDAALDDALAAITTAGVDGVIATNTTIGRSGLVSPHRAQDGGLSGAALTEAATRIVAEIRRRAGDGLPIIAAGGVMSVDDALAKMSAGADLIQVYTGLVFRGPRLLRELAIATQ
jgi:dihydroorotate dehydrogenase